MVSRPLGAAMACPTTPLPDVLFTGKGRGVCNRSTLGIWMVILSPAFMVTPLGMAKSYSSRMSSVRPMSVAGCPAALRRRASVINTSPWLTLAGGGSPNI